MNRILSALLILLLACVPAHPIGTYDAYIVGGRFGTMGTLTTATLALDSAFVYGTSGDAYIIVFSSPVTQTNAALTAYVYCTAVTGSPTSSSMDVYDSQTSTAGDPQRPPAGAAPIASSSDTDASGCGTAQWLTYSVASVSLTAGKMYFLIFQNDTATPGSNHFTLTTRGITISNARPISAAQDLAYSATTTDGITTDPGLVGSAIAMHGVMKFGDGTIIGNPYVASAASASNTNYRGTRFNLTEDMVIGGVLTNTTFTLTTVVTLEVYNGSTQLNTVTLDVHQKGNGGIAYFSAPVTFPGGTDIDVVFKLDTAATSGTYAHMGTSPPADVQSASSTFTYVTGAAAGSFSETTTQFIPMSLVIDENPAIAGGGGACIIGGGV